MKFLDHNGEPKVWVIAVIIVVCAVLCGGLLTLTKIELNYSELGGKVVANQLSVE